MQLDHSIVKLGVLTAMWKFRCESKDDIPLPPDYSFARAFNYLNPEKNSFFILENDSNYIQCGGSKDVCTVELREYQSDGSFRHYVFCHPGGSEELLNIPMRGGGANRQKKHGLHFRTAIELFTCYFESSPWPSHFVLEDITDQFL